MEAKRCWVSPLPPPPSPPPDARLSGVSFMEGLEYIGSTLQGATLVAASARNFSTAVECAHACYESPRCQRFTLKRTQHGTVKRFTCLLKTQAAVLRPSGCPVEQRCVSGSFASRAIADHSPPPPPATPIPILRLVPHMQFKGSTVRARLHAHYKPGSCTHSAASVRLHKRV